MSIPDVHPTGHKDVDYKLGMFTKWWGNGSPSMALGYLMRASEDMLRLRIVDQATDEQAGLLLRYVAGVMCEKRVSAGSTPAPGTGGVFDAQGLLSWEDRSA